MGLVAPPVVAVGWSPAGALRILDQRRLPDRVESLDHGTVAEVAEAIRTLAVRGAPAIGVAAAIGIGTALAPLHVGHTRGLSIEVFASETRPLLQGARLTAWELVRAGIPVTVLTDGMVASLMAAGRVELVIVGGDRIAANGDVANKVGTYGLAVLAKHHRIPFVVAAPWSTVDLAAEGAMAYNPPFDLMPHTLIHRIVTDRGVHAPPFLLSPTPGALPPPA